MASLTKVYCSLIIRASQFSFTTRNLVPRFKRWSKGGKVLVAKNLTSLLGLGFPFEEVDPFRWSLHFTASSHHDQFFILSSGSPSYLRIGKGQLYNDRMLQGKIFWGFPKYEHMSISRVEQMKHIESKVRRCNKKFQADRQSFIAWNRVWMGFRATGISIVSDTRSDH